jgi:hypothetical protein
MHVDLWLFVQEGGGCGTEMLWDSPWGSSGKREVRVIIVIVIIVLFLLLGLVIYLYWKPSGKMLTMGSLIAKG